MTDYEPFDDGISVASSIGIDAVPIYAALLGTARGERRVFKAGQKT